jgi:hypothetical protein
LLDRHERFVIRSTGKRFVIRSTGKRFVIDRKNVSRSVAELGARRRRRYQVRVVKVEDGKEKTYDLRYGVEPIRLVGRQEPWYLVVVAGFGEESPMTLRVTTSDENGRAQE